MSTESCPILHLTLTPPGPVTDRVIVEARGALHNTAGADLPLTIALLLPDGSTGVQTTVTVPVGGVYGLVARWPSAGAVGPQTISLLAGQWSIERTLDVLPAAMRGSGLISGAWVGIVHRSEAEEITF